MCSQNDVRSRIDNVDTEGRKEIDKEDDIEEK